MAGQDWSNALTAAFQAAGFQGQNLSDFSDAVGMGSVEYLETVTYETADVGLVAGSGAGTGVGLTGIPPSVVALSIFDAGVERFGQAGESLLDLADIIASVLVEELDQVMLSSTHSPVHAGVGTIVIGSFSAVGADWGLGIEEQAPSFQGQHWGDFAESIGIGCTEGIQLATGTVAISGAGTGFPGAGTGAGTLLFT